MAKDNSSLNFSQKTPKLTCRVERSEFVLAKEGCGPQHCLSFMIITVVNSQPLIFESPGVLCMKNEDF